MSVILVVRLPADSNLTIRYF